MCVCRKSLRSLSSAIENGNRSKSVRWYFCVGFSVCAEVEGPAVSGGVARFGYEQASDSGVWVLTLISTFSLGGWTSQRYSQTIFLILNRP